MTRYRKRSDEIEAYRTTHQRQVPTATALSPAEPGDWILTFPDGHQDVMHDGLFRRMYEPVESEGRAGHETP